jgi:adenine-specific DNA-methyltransferase
MKLPTNLGQYFTTNIQLQEKVFQFILNAPQRILEPSMGRGDLVSFINKRIPGIQFDLYEIDETIPALPGIHDVIYTDFMTHSVCDKYKTIIGNPPYVRTKTGNLYLDFVNKCYRLLQDGGELIFIVPSDFFKLTSAGPLLEDMMVNGTFTHIYHPHDEKMFPGASIDVIVYRYCKCKLLEKKVIYNGHQLYITIKSGLITFGDTNTSSSDEVFSDYFNIFVGMVSGKESVYKNQELGNMTVLNGKDNPEKYIYITRYPCESESINRYLEQHKAVLMSRKIKKFHEENWFEWGAPRNLKAINEHQGADCIYIYNLTRKETVAFTGKVGYFGGSLIMLVPKRACDLVEITRYINSNDFKNNFIFSGRFKIGHRQISNSRVVNL